MHAILAGRTEVAVASLPAAPLHSARAANGVSASMARQALSIRTPCSVDAVPKGVARADVQRLPDRLRKHGLALHGDPGIRGIVAAAFHECKMSYRLPGARRSHGLKQ